MLLVSGKGQVYHQQPDKFGCLMQHNESKTEENVQNITVAYSSLNSSDSMPALCLKNWSGKLFFTAVKAAMMMSIMKCNNVKFNLQISVHL